MKGKEVKKKSLHLRKKNKESISSKQKLANLQIRPLPSALVVVTVMVMMAVVGGDASKLHRV